MVPGLVAEAVASAMGAEAFEASAERLDPYEEFRASRRGAAKAAGSYRSRHRLGDPVQGSPVQGSPVQGSPAQGSLAPGSPAQGSLAPGSPPWDGMELVLAEPQPSDQALGNPRRTEARCMPRHAAPSAGFGSRLTGFSSRMTGLFADRALATGARG
jgi:hypothetical protein